MARRQTKAERSAGSRLSAGIGATGRAFRAVAMQSSPTYTQGFSSGGRAAGGSGS